METIKLDFLPDGIYSLLQVHRELSKKRKNICLAFKNETGIKYYNDVYDIAVTKITWPPVSKKKKVLFSPGEMEFIDHREIVLVSNKDKIDIFESTDEYHSLYFPDEDISHVPPITKGKKNIPFVGVQETIRLFQSHPYIEIIKTTEGVILFSFYDVELEYNMQTNEVISDDKKLTQYISSQVLPFLIKSQEDETLQYIMAHKKDRVQFKYQKMKLLDPYLFDFVKSRLSGNRYSRICQKKFHPDIYTDDEAAVLKLKPSKSVVRLPNMSQPKKYNWYKCSDKTIPYLGFITGEHPDNEDVCLPCCRVKDPIEKSNQESCLQTGMSEFHRNKYSFKTDTLYTIKDRQILSFLSNYGNFTSDYLEVVPTGNRIVLYSDSIDLKHFNPSENEVTIYIGNKYVLFKDEATIKMNSPLVKDIIYTYMKENEIEPNDDTELLSYNNLLYLISTKIRYKDILFNELLHTINNEDSIIGAIVKVTITGSKFKVYVPLSFQKTMKQTKPTYLKNVIQDVLYENELKLVNKLFPTEKKNIIMSATDESFCIKIGDINFFHKETTYVKLPENEHTLVGFSYYNIMGKKKLDKPVNLYSNKEEVYYFNLVKLITNHVNVINSNSRNEKIRSSLKFSSSDETYLFNPSIYPYGINILMNYNDSLILLKSYQEDIPLEDVQLSFDKKVITSKDIIEYKDTFSFFAETDYNDVCFDTVSPYYCSKKGLLIVPKKDKEFAEDYLEYINRLM